MACIGRGRLQCALPVAQFVRLLLRSSEYSGGMRCGLDAGARMGMGGDRSDREQHLFEPTTEDRPNAIRISDRVEAVVAHPFRRRLVRLRAGRPRVGGADPAPTRQRARDGYRVVFDEQAPSSQLVPTLDLTCRVSTVSRSPAWLHRARGTRLPGGGIRRQAAVWSAARRHPSYLGPPSQ